MTGEMGTLGNDERCNRCGGENVVWSAPSPLWNLVMRGNDINGDPKWGDLVCIRCFIVLAKVAGIHGRWQVSVDPEPDGLVKVTPSGRVWDDEKWLWVDAQPPEAHERGWKPGDVAVISVPNRDVFHRAFFDGETWRECGGGYYFSFDTPTSVRPLIVVDPEGRDVNRLVIRLGTRYKGSTRLMRETLRDLHTDPPPEEPEGLGAVVEDARGQRWVRTDYADHQWLNHTAGISAWADIAAVKVLSEGVDA